jgi:hypothetical protein
MKKKTFIIVIYLSLINYFLKWILILFCSASLFGEIIPNLISKCQCPIHNPHYTSEHLKKKLYTLIYQITKCPHNMTHINIFPMYAPIYIYINKEVFSVIHFPDMGVTEHGLYPPNAAKFKANTLINQWMFG